MTELVMASIAYGMAFVCTFALEYGRLADFSRIITWKGYKGPSAPAQGSHGSSWLLMRLTAGSCPGVSQWFCYIRKYRPRYVVISFSSDV